MMPASYDLYDGPGYLLTLRDAATGAAKAWLLLRTESFQPLTALHGALSALADAARDLAAHNGLELEEGSVGNLADRFSKERIDRVPGHSDALASYTYAGGEPDMDRLERHLRRLLRGKRVKPMVPVSGVVARIDESLMGRARAREGLLRTLEGGPVMLLGPRRSGKTSLLWWLKDEEPAEWACVYVDLERLVHPPALVAELAMELRVHPRARGRVGLPWLIAAGEPPEDGPGRTRWKDGVSRAIEADWAGALAELLTAAGEQPAPLLLLDELGDFLDTLTDEERAEFSGVIASVLSRGSHRAVLTGSRSLEHLLERHHLKESFDGFSRFRLPDLEPEAARHLLEESLRARRIRPGLDLARTAVELVGHQVPFYVQMLADAIATHAPPGDLTDEAVVERAYRESVLGYPGQAWFTDVEHRLRSYDAFRRRRTGHRILGMVAATAGGIEEAALRYRFEEDAGGAEALDELLALLEEYFCLEQVEARWRFRVPVLRDYALTYYPASGTR